MPEKKSSVKKRIIGASLKNLKELVIHFAKSGKNILLIGASGTGKELFAELYCNEIGRKFAPVNCSGISDTFLNSELFGHIKGAYTDAYKDRAGILSNGLLT
jgi:transcriptional regulator with GAF, ATPase, and Fis domain